MCVTVIKQMINKQGMRFTTPRRKSPHRRCFSPGCAPKTSSESGRRRAGSKAHRLRQLALSGLACFVPRRFVCQRKEGRSGCSGGRAGTVS